VEEQEGTQKNPPLSPFCKGGGKGDFFNRSILKKEADINRFGFCKIYYKYDGGESHGIEK
jgi:hypothetical protein